MESLLDLMLFSIDEFATMIVRSVDFGLRKPRQNDEKVAHQIKGTLYLPSILCPGRKIADFSPGKPSAGRSPMRQSSSNGVCPVLLFDRSIMGR